MLDVDVAARVIGDAVEAAGVAVTTRVDAHAVEAAIKA